MSIPIRRLKRYGRDNYSSKVAAKLFYIFYFSGIIIVPAFYIILFNKLLEYNLIYVPTDSLLEYAIYFIGLGGTLFALFEKENYYKSLEKTMELPYIRRRYTWIESKINLALFLTFTVLITAHLICFAVQFSIGMSIIEVVGIALANLTPLLWIVSYLFEIKMIGYGLPVIIFPEMEIKREYRKSKPTKQIKSLLSTISFIRIGLSIVGILYSIAILVFFGVQKYTGVLTDMEILISFVGSLIVLGIMFTFNTYHYQLKHFELSEVLERRIKRLILIVGVATVTGVLLAIVLFFIYHYEPYVMVLSVLLSVSLSCLLVDIIYFFSLDEERYEVKNRG